MYDKVFLPDGTEIDSTALPFFCNKILKVKNTLMHTDDVEGREDSNNSSRNVIAILSVKMRMINRLLVVLKGVALLEKLEKVNLEIQVVRKVTRPRPRTRLTIVQRETMLLSIKFMI